MNDSIDRPPAPLGPVPRRHDKLLEYIATAIESIRFGSVSVIIHDGRVVQVERAEKWRADFQESERGAPGRPTAAPGSGKPRI